MTLKLASKSFGELFSHRTVFRKSAGNFSLIVVRRPFSSEDAAFRPKIHTETFGDPHPTLAPVFVAHGMLGSCTNWTSLARKLNAKTGRQIVTFDARNHGLSGHADTMTYAEMSDDLLTLVETRFPERKVILMGHSMGGRTVMLAALTRSELVENLIVVDVSPVNVDFSTMDATEWNMAHFFHTMRNVKFLQPRDDDKWTVSRCRKDADRQMSGRIKDPALRSWLLMNVVLDEAGNEVRWRPNLDVIQKAFETDVRKFPNDRLPDDVVYQGRTTFIGGSESEYIPVADHPEILEKFPKAEFHYIQGAGHWVHSQKPQEFLQLVLKKL